MKSSILIIGSGFAGMWAAVSAARLAHLNNRQDVEISVLAPQPELRVRPRFYEDNALSLGAPLMPLFNELGVKFITGHAEHIDAQAKTVAYRDAQGTLALMQYDRVILATGSVLQRPGLPGMDRFAFDIDQMESARAFELHLASLADRPVSAARNTVVVCGGGFTGIELATELPTRLRAILGENAQTKVIVVDRGQTIGGRFSAELRDVIAQASDELGIEWHLNSAVEAIDENGVTLQDGTHIATHTVVWTAGVKASDLGEQLNAPRDNQQRLIVNGNLQLPDFPDVYATGDMARAKSDDLGNYALMTCQHAIQLGKFAGHNAMASLLGGEPLPYRQEVYVTCLDLGAWGAVYTEGWDQQVKSLKEEGKKIKLAITHELIYPPEANRDVAFAAADPLAKFV